MRLLLVDDDTTLAEVTAFALRRAGFVVDIAQDGEQALQLWERERPDLILLDIQLPGVDGLTLCRLFRQQSAVPIIMLTVRDSDEDIVHGFEIGADDYVTKPFSPKQLIARAKAVVRRAQLVPQPTCLTAGTLTIDTGEQCARTLSGRIHLTSLEFRLLHLLMTHQNQVVPTETMLTHVWGYATSADRALLKQLVYRLRQKLLQAEHEMPHIETVAGVGYRLHSERLVEDGDNITS
jgi:DNA-binding response OmpR family regulator